MNAEDKKLYQIAVKKCKAVEARAVLNPRTQGHALIRCFNKKGKEVALWVPGVSKNIRRLEPPRKWLPSRKRDMPIVSTKEKEHAKK